MGIADSSVFEVSQKSVRLSWLLAAREVAHLWTLQMKELRLETRSILKSLEWIEGISRVGVFGGSPLQ